MAKVYAPNKKYNGICAGIGFVNGVGECADPHLLDWFAEKGYSVVDSEPEMTVDELKKLAGKMGFQVIPNDDPGEEQSEKTLADMTVKELRAYAEEHKIELKNGSKADIVQQITDALAIVQTAKTPVIQAENAPDDPPEDNPEDDEDEDEDEDEPEDEDETPGEDE